MGDTTQAKDEEVTPTATATATATATTAATPAPTALSPWSEAWTDGPDDFLSDPAAVEMAALADKLESCRRDLASWASLAVVSRQPQVSPHRGVKGTRTIEADVDAILRGLIGGLRGQDQESLQRHARWFAAVLATRPAGPAALEVELDTLQEGLFRWLGRSHAKPANVALAAAYARAMPASCIALLDELPTPLPAAP